MGGPIGNKHAVGNKGGREKYWTLERIQEEAIALKKWMKKDDSIFLKDFAVERGYLSQRFSEFNNECQEFAEIYSIAKEWQESKLVKGGLYNKTNPGFTKFILVNHHNYRETPVNVIAVSPKEFDQHLEIVKPNKPDENV